MPIADGDPADDGDIWFRVLTEDDNKYIRKGKIHPNAFKGKNAIVAPDPQKNRPWDHELSGRLRSLTNDVVAEANAYCEEMTKRTGQTKKFGGVMFCSVQQARQVFEGVIATRVYYTPLPTTDRAHADLTFNGSVNAAEQVFDKLRLWLCNVVTGLYPAQIELLPRAETSPAAYSAPR
jgi:hypothetical protein